MLKMKVIFRRNHHLLATAYTWFVIKFEMKSECIRGGDIHVFFLISCINVATVVCFLGTFSVNYITFYVFEVNGPLHWEVQWKSVNLFMDNKVNFFYHHNQNYYFHHHGQHHHQQQHYQHHHQHHQHHH